MTRTWPLPTEDRTLQLVGDVHFGAAAGTEFSAARRATVAADLLRPTVPTVARRVQVGDLTNTATPAQDTEALAWFAELGGTTHYVVGNHDMWGVRSGSEAAAAWGLPAKDYAVDLGHCTLIVLGPDDIHPGNLTGCRYSDTSLNFLDEALSASSNPCVIAAHAPLYGTVGAGGPATEYRSTDQYFYAATDSSYLTDAGIRSVLAAHDNVAAWVSGHTHSPMTANHVVKTEVAGGRTFAAVNAGCLAYTGTTREWLDPLVTLFLTVLDDRVEVRFRDHAAHQWITAGPDNRRVWDSPFGTAA